MNKGYFYAMLSAVLLPAATIINKYLLSFVNPRMLSFLFFVSVFIGSSAFILFRNPRSFLANIINHWKDGIIVGGFNALAATFFFLSLSIIDAATTSFLVRFSTIFIILIGVFFLKEKLTRYDIPGILLAVGGALVINYSNGEITKLGFLIALVAAVGIALHQVSAKMFVKKVNPLALVNLRTLFSSAFLFMVAVSTSSVQPIELKLLPIVFLSGAVVAMAGFFFYYKSLELIDVSKAAVIRTLDPFVILFIGLLVFHTLPTPQEIFGGTLIVAGVVMVMLKRRIRELVDSFKLPWLG